MGAMTLPRLPALAAALVAVACSGAVGPPARAGDGPPSDVSAAAKAHPRCTIVDRRTPEISGATALGPDDLLVVNDKRLELFRVDARCRVSSWWRAPDPAPGTKAAVVDVEDLATAPDGTVWLLDGGGNRISRRVIHLVGVPNPDSRPSLPAKPLLQVDLVLPRIKMDIEAFVVTRDFRVVLVTKVAKGPAEVLVARLNPVAGAAPVAVERIGALDLSSVPGPPKGAQSAVTGLALSPDGGQVALRTPTDVFSVDLAGRPVAEAVVKGPWQWVQSVVQRQGEAITYSTSGSELLLLSEQLPSPVLTLPVIRAATPASAPASPEPVDRTWLIAAGGVGIFLGALALRWIPGRRPFQSPIGAPFVIGTAVFALGASAVAFAATRIVPEYAGSAVVSFVPRNPVSTGSDTLQLLQSRFVAALENPALLASARQLAQIDAKASSKATVDVLVDPGTVNLSITVHAIRPDVAAALANSLAVLIRAEAAEDPLVYARQSAVAVPPRTPSVPTVRQLAGIGNLGTLIAALLAGCVVARRLRPVDLGGAPDPSAQPPQENS